MGANVVLLDGISIRSGLSRELDFSEAGRAEHLRRVASFAKLLNDKEIMVICCFISPENDIREQVSEIIGKSRFRLVFMDSPIEFCRKNEPELYRLAEANKIDNFPGVSYTYEPPVMPDLIITPEDDGEILSEKLNNFIRTKLNVFFKT